MALKLRLRNFMMRQHIVENQSSDPLIDPERLDQFLNDRKYSDETQYVLQLLRLLLVRERIAPPVTLCIDCQEHKIKKPLTVCKEMRRLTNIVTVTIIDQYRLDVKDVRLKESCSKQLLIKYR